MGRKGRPDDPCPCGSGIKFKKCCGRARGAAKPASVRYSPAERASALEELTFFVDELWKEEEEVAFAELWDRSVDRERELPADLRAMSNAVLDGWSDSTLRVGDEEDLPEEQVTELEQVEVARATKAGATAEDDACVWQLLDEMTKIGI